MRGWLSFCGSLATCVALGLTIAAPPAGAFINDSPNLPQAQDTNTDPRIFETTITARQGTANVVSPFCLQQDLCRVPNAITFNGSIAGPEIRVRVGDRVKVHYVSQLPASAGNTSIHWHGVELDNRSDGTAVTQLPVGPGGTIDYDFIVPRPGIFWFHGHMSPSNPSLKGQYGSLIVTGVEDERLQSFFVLPPPSRTKTLMLSDITTCKAAGSNDGATFPADAALPWAGDTNGDGVRDPFPGKRIGPSPRALCETPMDNNGNRSTLPLAARTIPNVQYEPESCPATRLIDLSAPCTINEGQSVLVNGRIPAARGGSPDGGAGPTDVAATLDVLSVQAGDTYRFQMTNAALSRYFRLQLADRNGLIPLFRVGGEGGVLNATRLEGGLNTNPRYGVTNGLNSAGNPQYTRGEILLAPGQRADVVFNVPRGLAPGEVVTLWTRDFQRGMGNDGPNPLEKSPTGPCALGPGRCGPNGYSLVPTAPVLHMKIANSSGFASFPAAALNTPLRTDARVAMPLEDQRFKAVTRLLTPAEAGQTTGSTVASIKLHMGGGEEGFLNSRPQVDDIAAMLDDNKTRVPVSSIARPKTTRYVRLGELVELKIKNTTGMNHPFHLHGASFQPVRLETNPDCTSGTPTVWRNFEYPEFMDTIDIPACSQLVFRVRYDDRSRTFLGVKTGGANGRWVFHCHIFEHATDGMMGEVDVVSPGPTFFGLRTAGRLARGATVTAMLRRTRTVLLKVDRVVKPRGRPTRHVAVGRVRLGRLPAGRSLRRWNLRVNGRPLRPGRYKVSLVADLGKGLLSAPAKPGPRTLVVFRSGKVR